MKNIFFICLIGMICSMNAYASDYYLAHINDGKHPLYSKTTEIIAIEQRKLGYTTELTNIRCKITDSNGNIIKGYYYATANFTKTIFRSTADVFRTSDIPGCIDNSINILSIRVKIDPDAKEDSGDLECTLGYQGN